MARLFTLRDGTHMVFDGDVEGALRSIIHALAAYDQAGKESLAKTESGTPVAGQVQLLLGASTFRDAVGRSLDKAASYFPADQPPSPCEYCEKFHSDDLACRSYVDAKLGAPAESGSSARDVLRELDNLGMGLDDWEDFQESFLKWHRERVLPLLYPEDT